MVTYDCGPFSCFFSPRADIFSECVVRKFAYWTNLRKETIKHLIIFPCFSKRLRPAPSSFPRISRQYFWNWQNWIRNQFSFWAFFSAPEFPGISKASKDGSNFFFTRPFLILSVPGTRACRRTALGRRSSGRCTPLSAGSTWRWPSTTRPPDADRG